MIRQHGRPHRAGLHGEQALKFGDDVVEVLLRAEALPFEHFDIGGDLPHIGNRGFFEGHAVAGGAVGAHGVNSHFSASSTVCGLDLVVGGLPH